MKKANQITGPNAGGPCQSAIRTWLAGRVGQFPVGRKRMRTRNVITISIVCLSALMGPGCASTTKVDRPEVQQQLQKSVVLSASRYIAVLHAIESGDVQEIQKDIDWWIDQAILELVLLEERYPDGNWASVKLQDIPLEMRSVYRRLAQFRRDHPRRHSVPLEKERLEQIEAFTKKYQ